MATRRLSQAAWIIPRSQFPETTSVTPLPWPTARHEATQETSSSCEPVGPRELADDTIADVIPSQTSTNV